MSVRGLNPKGLIGPAGVVALLVARHQRKPSWKPAAAGRALAARSGIARSRVVKFPTGTTETGPAVFPPRAPEWAGYPYTLAAVALANGSVEIPSGGSIGYAVEKSHARLEIRHDAGTGRAILLKRDATVSANAVPIAIKILGEVKGSAIILLHTYRSVPGGMSCCKAGKEEFLRVIST